MQNDRENPSLNLLRTAQRDWKSVAVADRAVRAKQFSQTVARHARDLHRELRSMVRADFRETIAAEILPLAESASWLARNAARVLRDRRVGSSQRPIWLGNVRSTVVREPLGVVFILGTWNYPIFLTGVQALQALVAGNAVVIKPAPGCEAITQVLLELFLDAGFPEELIERCDASVESAESIFDTGVDRVIMTGSSQSGRRVLGRLANHLTSATMELSGCDALMVLENADLDRVTAAILFGLRLNSGATCIAPRRVFVPLSLAEPLYESLTARLEELPALSISSGAAERIREEIARGRARMLMPSWKERSLSEVLHASDQAIAAGRPVILVDLASDCPLAVADIFAPLTMIHPYSTLNEALAINSRCPYGLTASIFGDEQKALVLAKQLNVGSVVINDLIVPTADPRLPFGGVGESGFGVTRGEEGLLELTRPKVTSVRRGRWLQHLESPQPRDEQILEGLLQWRHEATWRNRWRGLQRMMNAVWKKR